VWLQDVNGEDSAPVTALTTRDGGRTWKSATEPRPPAQAVPAAQDTRWKLTQDGQTVRLERQEPGGPSQVRAELPVNWERKGARLVPRR
jgi:hypothetical protein